ncbi:MAG: YceI family protein [Sandaracinaceae bacterium]
MAFLALCAAIPSGASAQRATFSAGRGSRIQFVSDAPLERMTGTTSGLSGDITWDPSNLSQVSGTFTVPVTSLRTGIDLRDEHLRGDSWLDAGRFPNLTLEVERVEGATRLEPNSATRIRLHGSFTVHGVSRPVVVNATVRYIPGEHPEIRAQGRFTVRLTDHNISVPAPVRLKVSNEIVVNVSLRARAG